MATQRAEQFGHGEVGTRPRAEVEEARGALEAIVTMPPGTTPFRRGALVGYLWALGRVGAAPVTGASVVGTPGIELLTAEVDAALVRLEDLTRDEAASEYTRGVQEALAWVCGHRDDRP